jgi:hypothetical protein
MAIACDNCAGLSGTIDRSIHYFKEKQTMSEADKPAIAHGN